MMRWLVDACLKSRVVVIVLAAAMMFFGGRELRGAPVDTLPEFGPTTVEIQTEALGLSAAEVEQLITVPLEADLLVGLAWLDVIRSESVPGMSSIELIFEPGTDVLKARQVVQERLVQAHALPNVSRPPTMLQPVSSLNRVMMVGLSSKELSLIEMSVLARWTVKPRLLGVEGVANVAVWGQREQQLQVQVDPERMRNHDVSLEEVVATTGNALWVSPLSFLEASTPGTGGFIDTTNQRLGIQHIQPITSPADLARVPIEDKPTVLLSDVATLVIDHQPLIGNAIINDGPGLLLVIEKFPGTNTLEVTRAIEDALADLRPGMAGVEIDSTIYRPATSVDAGIDKLGIAAVIGLVLAVLVFAAFFFGWRAALVGLVAIPSSLMAAGLALYLLGTTFNVIVVAGLVVAIAVVVDDVIIDVEHIVRRLRERRAAGSGLPVASIILDASMEMRSSAMLALLIIALSVLPAFFLNGESGEFFPTLGLAYGAGTAAAMLVSLTLTPALASLLLSSAPVVRTEPAFVRSLKRGYGAALSRFVQLQAAPYVAVVVIAVAGIAAFTQLSQPSLLPSFDERDLLVHWDGPPGTSQTEMSRIVTTAGQELRSVEGVRNVGVHVGRAVTSDQIVGVNAAELWLSIDPDADYDATISGIQEVVDGYPGLSRDVATYSEERVADKLVTTAGDITVRVYGEDFDVLTSKAAELKDGISKIDGVHDAQVRLPTEEPGLEVKVDLAAAQRYGVRPGDVRRAAATLLSGIEVGSLFEEQKVFEVVVWSTPATRASVTSVLDLPIDTPDGSFVRLDDVADVRIAGSPDVIRREAVSRYLDIGINVSGRGAGAVSDDVHDLLRATTFPLEHHAELLADEGRQTPADHGLALGIAAAIGIFLLFQAAFGSWRLAALSFVTLPLALAGGVVAAYADGGDITIASYAAFIALAGLAARNSVVLIHSYQRLEEEGNAVNAALALAGAKERLAPTLMTALVTALALGSLLIFGDMFGREVVRPLAIVMLGGLVTSTALILFIIPGLYVQFALGREAVVARAPRGIQSATGSGGGK